MTQFSNSGWSPDMHPALWMARETVRAVYKDIFDRDYVITSAMRPQSPGGSSLHPKGRAMDIRTRDLQVSEITYLAEQIREALGEDFDVVVEGRGGYGRYRGRPDHIHIEHDPDGRHAQRLADHDQDYDY